LLESSGGDPTKALGIKRPPKCANSRALVRLIDDLLDISRITRPGSMELRKGTSLATIVHAATVTRAAVEEDADIGSR
jgi:hypothetical protein